MIYEIPGSQVLVMASIVYLFLLWETNSLMSSYTVTGGLSAIILSYLFHTLGLGTMSFAILLSAMSVSVWRVLTHKHQDSWNR